MSNLKNELLLKKLQECQNEFHELIDLESSNPELFKLVKAQAAESNVIYSVWLRQQGFFNVETKRGQLSTNQIMERLSEYADDDGIIEDLKNKDRKIVDIVLTRAIFNKEDSIAYVKKITGLTWHRRGVNDNEVINIKLAKIAKQNKFVVSEELAKTELFEKIKWQVRKEKISINDWFKKHSSYIYLSKQALDNYDENILTDNANQMLFSKNPTQYFQNVKSALIKVLTENYVESLSDIRKIDNKLANSIRYLQRFYPTGTLESWYDLVEIMGLTPLISKPKTYRKHNRSVESVLQELKLMLETNYPNKVVRKTNSKFKYLTSKLSAYYNKPTKEIVEELGYQYPNASKTIKRLKSVKVLKKPTVAKSIKIGTLKCKNEHSKNVINKIPN